MRGMIPVLMLMSAGSLCTTAALAEGCHGPSAPSSFPDPSTATEQEMLAAQQSVKQYLSDMEVALKCMSNVHDDQAHDLAVDNMQKTAAKFNSVLRAFRTRQQT